MISPLQKLQPVAVPWMISPSVPLLTLNKNEQDLPLSATFVGYFALDDQTDVTLPSDKVQVVRSESFFIQGADTGLSSHHMVRVRFHDAVVGRMCPAFGDHEVVPEANYDWSLISSRMRDEETIDKTLTRTRQAWIATGFCLSPRMYEVLNSHWIQELAIQDKDVHHYLLLGHDEYVDVIAKGWDWERGQAVE